MSTMLTNYEGRTLHTFAADNYETIAELGFPLPWIQTDNIIWHLPQQTWELSMEIHDYIHCGNETPGKWITSFTKWAQQIGFTVNFTQHDTRRQYGNSCGVVAAFVAYKFATSRDFSNVVCDEAISRGNTMAGYETIGIHLTNPNDAPVIPDHNVQEVYNAYFGDNTQSHPLFVETYDRLHLDVAQRMVAALCGNETHLRLVISNTHEAGQPGNHYFTIAYKIVRKNVNSI